MKVVFLSGSRAITRLGADVRRRIDEFVDQRVAILVGDANGADKTFQRHLALKRYQAVTVFFAGDRCRNNVAQWPARRVDAHKSSKGYEFYAHKDREMARDATDALMIWDGKSLGTALNVVRMLRQGKEVELYETSAKRHSVLRSETDWTGVLATRDRRFAEKLRERAAQEPALAPTDPQSSFGFAGSAESRTSESAASRTT
jgi:hypothetical protein